MLLEKRLFRPWPTNEQQRTDGEDGRSCWRFAKWSQAHPASLNLSNLSNYDFFSFSLDSKATFGQFSLGWRAFLDENFRAIAFLLKVVVVTLIGAHKIHITPF